MLPRDIRLIFNHHPLLSLRSTVNFTPGIFLSLVTSSQLRNAVSCLCAPPPLLFFYVCFSCVLFPLPHGSRSRIYLTRKAGYSRDARGVREETARDSYILLTIQKFAGFQLASFRSICLCRLTLFYL